MENPWYYRGYRGITAVPITVQLSSPARVARAVEFLNYCVATWTRRPPALPLARTFGLRSTVCP